MSRPLFVLVEGGKLHRNPAFEDCNVDDASVVNRFKTLGDVPPKGRTEPCAKCKPLDELEFPDQTPPPPTVVEEGAEAGPVVAEGGEIPTELPDPADG